MEEKKKKQEVHGLVRVTASLLETVNERHMNYAASLHGERFKVHQTKVLGRE